MDVPEMVAEIRKRGRRGAVPVSSLLGVSNVTLERWEQRAGVPSPAQLLHLQDLFRSSDDRWQGSAVQVAAQVPFASRGVRKRPSNGTLGLFDAAEPEVVLAPAAYRPLVTRLATDGFFNACSADVRQLLARHEHPAIVAAAPPVLGMSAGKNTYAYDAHTYHTKVPPQGIAELLTHYLPDGGLVLDPFSGTGMTGVAARALGLDSVLTDLSPAACFIGSRFTASMDPPTFVAGIRTVLNATRGVRESLYSTSCRECGRRTEILYTVWSYQVLCSSCDTEFLLWDECRIYGERVRDHKIASEFPCPQCGTHLKKSRLRRTLAVPVQLGYICCGSKQQERTHPLSAEDTALIAHIQRDPPLVEGAYPRDLLPDGVNLRQPRNHGMYSVDQLYTPRNLAAMSHIWSTINRVSDVELAAHLAFVFTSLYQRVTKLSEFRFWGGSGNTARYNVPFIFNEANVFRTFERKARTIQDHLESTAGYYSGRCIVANRSATQLDLLPDESVDLIFTDPPFGGNINYSEMNLIWESWLGAFTNNKEEAIINKVQGKGLKEYQKLMEASIRECYRVLRSGHWMLLVFMNSSGLVWDALRTSILHAGFDIVKVDSFDKQHGTFKQFVSENTAGCDLVLHCRKEKDQATSDSRADKQHLTLDSFLASVEWGVRRTSYLHVSRAEETDYRSLYGDWVSLSLTGGEDTIDFPSFRLLVDRWLAGRESLDPGR